MIKAMAPKVNDKGGKSIALISTQLSKYLSLYTMMMMTWGISDFVGENGESDGKFGISLNFPTEGYDTPETRALLEKFREFQNVILDMAVENSMSWFGKKLTREVAEYTFFPIVKMSKNKETKQVDASSSASIRAKVPNYQGKWGVEIYTPKGELIFPCDDPNMTPMDFVPKMSNVACTLQCTGVWTGGKGWGVTWKLQQCIVKPKIVETVFGRCHIQLSEEDAEQIEKQPSVEAHEEATSPPAQKAQVAAPIIQAISTEVEDSDDEQEQEQEQAPVQKQEEEEVVQEEPAPAVVEEVKAATVVKKVVKKAVTTPVPEPAPVVEEETKPAVKKVLKKKVV
jgi:hypothetical protein